MWQAVLWPLAWMGGVWAQLQQVQLWPATFTLALMGVALAALAAMRMLRGRPRLVAGAAVALALGAASTAWQADQRLAEHLAPGLEGRDLQLTGVVARLPQRHAAGLRFLFEVESAQLDGQPVRVPELVALGWYATPDADGVLPAPANLRAGERWRFTARLRQPHGNLNPHGFDYELWLFEQGVRASGGVRSRAGDPAVRLDAAAAHPVERLRHHLRDRIEARVADPAAAGVLAALAIGDQGAIDRADWELFRITGVAHLVSISGLHVTMFAWLAGALVGRVWRRSTRLMLAMPAPQAARWGGLMLATAYAVLAGWGVPAQRTVVMIAVVAALRQRGRHWPQPLVLAAAGGVVTLLDPWALLQPGFWLSFVAVAMLIASDPAHAPSEPPPAAWADRAMHTLRAALRTQAIATVGLTPLTLVFFQQVSLVGFAANLLAIPLVTLAITPLALLGVLVPPLWLLAAWLVQAMIAGLTWMAAWPAAVWSAPVAPAWAAALGLAGGALLVMPLPWRLRLCGLPLMLPLLAPTVPLPPEGRFELLALDVGQGTAVLVRTRQHLLVYDTGPVYSQDSDAGLRVLVPLLRSRGEPHVDLLMLSHRDTDHVGGAASLLARMPVVALSSSLGEAHALATRGVPASRCGAGQRWSWDGVDFELLHPDDASYAAAGRPNSVSCVLRVSGPQGRALLTGDIERAQELALLDRARDRLAADMLLVPHHGSRTSSTEAFIDAVSPRVAVVQAAYRSRFGHPAPDVVARYTQRGIAVVRTDRCGAWTWAPDGGEHCERFVSRRYWHHRVGEETDESNKKAGR